jgi:DNA-binding beta-propeller fold protein YncE
MVTGQDTLLVRFNDNYATFTGSMGFDPYNQRYFVGGTDENNNNILMQFNVATGRLEQTIPVAVSYDQVFWNPKTNTLLGLTNNTLVALDLQSRKTFDLAFVPGIPSLFGGAFDERGQQYYTVNTVFGQMQFTRVDLTVHPARRQTLDIWNDFTGLSFVPARA